MSDSTVYNLLRGTAGKVYSATLPENATYMNAAEFVLDAPHAKGDAFTLSFDVRLSAPGRLSAYLYNPDGNTNKSVYVDDTYVRDSVDGYVWYEAGPEWRHVAITWEYKEVPVQPVDRIITARMFRANTAGTTVEVRNLMMVRGTTPAAWAPAEGETLAGGGASMSANLLEGIAPTLVSGTTESDGVWHNAGTSTDSHKDWLMWDLPDQAALETNQTYHVGLSVKGATAHSGHLRPIIGYEDAAGHKNWAVPASLVVGASWGRAEVTIVIPSGMTPFAFYVAAYGACPETWMAAPTLSLGSPVTLASDAHTPYATQDHVAAEYATKAALKVTSDAVTAEVTERGKLAGRVGTLESTTGTHTSRLEQLAASIKSLVRGESTYTDPDGKSATSGIYSLVEQTRDSVTALFGSYTKTADMQSQIATAKSQATSAANSATDGKLASYTKTADLASTAAVKDAKKAGTDAASAASAAQSTANTAKSAASAAQSTADTAKSNAATAQSTADAAKSAASKAQSTADAAKGTADGLATMIRQDADGVTVGKSADGKTWSTMRTRMGASAFEVLTKAGEVASSFGEKIIELGKNSQDAAIRMLGGLVTIKATSAGVSDGAWCEISTDEFVSTNGYHASRIAAGYKDETGFIPQGVAEVMAQGGEGDGGVLLYAGAHGSDGNSLSLYPGGFTMNHPEYMLSALGLGSYGPVSPSSPYGSLTFCVRAGVATLWVSWGTTADPWGKAQCGEWVVPEAYRPRMDLNAPVALASRGTGDTGDTRLVVEASTGKIYWQNLGGGHSATTFDALVSWGIE